MNDADAMLATLAREYSVLAGVAANMSSGFILFNQHEHVTYFNTSALRLLGISSRMVVEQPKFDLPGQLLTLAADPDSVESTLNTAWRHTEEETSMDVALADAAVRWLRVHFFPVRDTAGSLLGRGVLLDDITLERSSIETRSETLALAAHELKTPIAIIKGCATTLLGNSLRWDPNMLREMLQMIDTQADRLYEVLNTLLDVWRLDSGTQMLRLSEVHPADLLVQIVERWQKNDPHHRFSLTLPDVVPMLVCDAARFEQIMNALLNNAVKYSPDGSTITVRLESNDFEVRMSVADEGIGIESEHLDRIFDRFYRVQQEDTPGSSGLGLAVARATIEAHGGKIWADSPGTGQGTTIYFTLPFVPHNAAMLVKQAQATSITGSLIQPTVRSTGPLRQSQRRQVLIGEGDARMLRYLRANLEEHHYRVQTVSSGSQFLRQLDLEDFDLIILSTRLMDMSGIELLQRLREFSQTPVIMLCDDCAEDERVQLFDLGTDDLVVKPFGMKELLARMRALLRRQPILPEQATSQAIFTTGDLIIDYAQHQVLLHGRPVHLSKREYKLLSTLARNVGMVLTHEVLLERVWGPEYDREVGFIWVYISRLRRKLEADPRNPRYILTIPDVGYKLAKM
ncbi:MAG TPA: ATP-binding protein [Ktedonobacteraceae bacterium]|nr:ATP-binding protein [Ktedonobacteraceae bacterium]